MPNPLCLADLHLSWSDPRWIVPAATGVLFIGLALLRGYVNVRRPALWRFGLAGLKLVAASLIALCLLNPLLSRTRPKPGENIVALLADNSHSLTIRDGAEESRGSQLATLLQEREAPWQVRIAQDFDVRRFECGERLTACEDFRQLDFTQPDSRLLGAVQALQSRFQNLPLAATLFFTDGNATDAALLDAVSLNCPVFPVLPREQKSLIDLSIGSVAVSQTPFEDAPITVQATLNSIGLDGQAVIGWLEPVPTQDESTESADRQQQELVLDSQGRGSLRFELAPVDVGTLFYRLRVLPVTSKEAFERPDLSPECTLANNERVLAIDHRGTPRRILYVSGRPNWEHKFLNRAVAADTQVQLVSLIRIARKEAKFDFRGRAGDSSNPLFRGFKDQADEETESYNQPVLIRLNTKDADELRDGFPKTKAELFVFDAIILDDVEGEFFTREQQQLIDRFVSERGGGLLMLGGLDTFRQGNWDKTSVRDALPVYLNRPTEQPQVPVRLKLTREGWLQPWVRLRSTEEDEQMRLSELPPFSTVTVSQHIKPAARVMAEVEDEQGQVLPALVVQSYGKGQAAALLPGDLWRWNLHRTTVEQDDLGKAWRQMLRWLVTDTPERSTLAVSPVPGNLWAYQIQVRLRDREYQPLDNAAVSIKLSTPQGEEIPYQAEPALSEPGLFEVTVMAREPGAYRVTSTAVVGDGAEILNSNGGWVSAPRAQEFATTSVNRTLMEQLAAKSGGKVLTIDELPAFVDSLQQRELPVMETESSPLWHSPWLLMLAMSLLIAEWAMRRTRGLT